MTVESNYVIGIATLSDWLKRLAPVFQPMRSKIKTNRTMYAWFSRVSSELQVVAKNCDWFIALHAPLVIGRSNCFGFWFFDSHLKTALFSGKGLIRWLLPFKFWTSGSNKSWRCHSCNRFRAGFCLSRFKFLSKSCGHVSKASTLPGCVLSPSVAVGGGRKKTYTKIE